MVPLTKTKIEDYSPPCFKYLASFGPACGPCDDDPFFLCPLLHGVGELLKIGDGVRFNEVSLRQFLARPPASGAHICRASQPRRWTGSR